MQTEFSPSTGPASDDGPTCEHGPNQTQSVLTLSVEGSPAKTFPLRVQGQVLMGHAPACGQNSTVSFASYDRESQSWRTRQGCLIEGLTEFSETWPQAGTMRNGACYRRALWVPHTHGPGCFSWPTPRASSRDNCGGSHARAKAKREGKYIGRNINPEFQESLMGFPIGWTELPVSETPSAHACQNGSGEES